MRKVWLPLSKITAIWVALALLADPFDTSFQIRLQNPATAPTGRPAGALAWAGLANLYYWIDRANGVGGYWATQIFPFADPTSVAGFLAMEKATYQHATLRAR